MFSVQAAFASPSMKIQNVIVSLLLVSELGAVRVQRRAAAPGTPGSLNSL